MATPMRSQDFRAAVEPILNTGFDGIYKQRADEWKAFASQQNGTPRSYHEEYVQYGFGAAPELPDGQAITYQSGGVLFVQRYVYRVFGLAFALTKVLVEDGEAINIGSQYSKHLAQSMVETKETRMANILNRGFNGSYLGGDGVALMSTAHPIANGSFSNQLAVSAALSQTSLEQMLIQIRDAVDNNGKKIRLEPKKLIIPTANMMQAEVILNSVLKTGSANNDLNAIKSLNLVSEGASAVSRLTSTTAWFVTTTANDDNGIKLLMRRKMEKGMEGDFETDSMKYKSTERYGEGWTDPRGIFGTAGV